MSSINYNDNNTEDIIKNNSQPNDISSPTYPTDYCPLCDYSMPIRDDYNDLDEYDDDLEEYDDEPGYRQRPRRRRRRRRRYPYYPYPYYPYPYYPYPYYPRPYYPSPYYPRPY